MEPSKDNLIQQGRVLHNPDLRTQLGLINVALDNEAFVSVHSLNEARGPLYSKHKIQNLIENLSTDGRSASTADDFDIGDAFAFRMIEAAIKDSPYYETDWNNHQTRRFVIKYKGTPA